MAPRSGAVNGDLPEQSNIEQSRNSEGDQSLDFIFLEVVGAQSILLQWWNERTCFLE